MKSTSLPKLWNNISPALSLPVIVFMFTSQVLFIDIATAAKLLPLPSSPPPRFQSPPPPPRPQSPPPPPPRPQPPVVLSPTYYQKSCPGVEGIVQRTVRSWVKRDATIAASIIRLHFHDCVVRGCDASILLDHDGSEKRARASRTLRGFSLIEEIKSNIEKVCPKKVSCADILTIAARDATVLAGGPFWEIPFGRKDGRISYAEEADSIVPEGRENITSLINLFEKSLGLTVLDLVVLSGAHTIGRSTCPSILPRVTATKAPYTQFVNSLKYKCSPKNNSEIFVNFDATTPKIFDEVYYKNLGKNMGLLLTDQLLYSDSRTSPIVKAFATQRFLFTGQFAGSMIRLGNVVGKAPYEIRTQCTSINK